MNLYESIKKNLKTKERISKLNESIKLKEMGNFANRMDTIRAAGDRAASYRKDVANQKNEKIRDLFNRLKEIQDDVAELKEIDRHVRLYDLKDKYGMWLDASDRGLDYENSEEHGETLHVDTDRILMSEPYLATSEVTADEMTKPSPFHHKNTFIKLATEMLDNYPGYIQAVNKMIDDYDLKYPVKSQEGVNESCGKKRLSIKESNLARYLGVTMPLTEKVNHANDDINAKIREALRSKTAARKYADDFKKAGITVDDSPREGVVLIGPNGRRLSADRVEIYGPAKPGHNDTHDRRYSSIKSKVKDLDAYDKIIADQKERIENLKNTERDDIIRKYPNKTTEEALKAHEDDIAREERDLDWNKGYRKDTQKEIASEHKRRTLGHNSELEYGNRLIDRKSPITDKIDYKGYLDSKDNSENKDFTAGGWRKSTPGQQVRQELKNAKSKVRDTYYYASDARDDLEDRKIDAKSIEARRKEIEKEYKQRMDDEVNRMLKKKSDADSSYKGHKEDYNKRVKALNDFRKQHNLPTKDEDSFDDYLEKKANSSRW